MEGCPKPVMISFDTKETSPAEFDSVKAYIRDYYQESGDNYKEEIQQLNKLRKGIMVVTRDNQGCIALRRYYAQLQFLQSRFPMGEGGTAAIPFIWYDVYNGDPVTQEDIRFEQACVLFNLGGLYSQLGANEVRSSEEGMKTACTYFQCAAGIFQFLLDNFSLDSFTDMTRDIIQLKLTIMLGQSQECLLEKSIRDNRKNALIARICAQVEDYYEDATKLLENSTTSEMGSTLRKSWTRHLKIKMLMFRALENVYMANQADVDEKFGDKVAFLKVATACIADAGQLSKNQPEEVVEPLRFIGDVVGNKYNGAVKDNDFVYHASVPSSDKLPAVIGVSLVKPMPFVYDDKDVYISDIFKKLIPMKAHETSSLYSEKKSELLREISDEIEAKDLELSENLTSMQIDDLMDPKSDNLPESLLSIHHTLATDQSQVDEVSKGAEDLRKLSHVLESNLVELALSLQEEEESELAAKMTNYQEAISEITSFRKDLEQCQEAHLKADKTNTELVKHIEENESVIRLLCGPMENIIATLPSQDVIEEVPTDEPVVQRIREILGKVEKMKIQRKELLQQLRDKITKDDITNLIVTKEDGNMEQFFKEHLQKHDDQCSIIRQNLSAQDNILSALMETNAKYASTRKAVRDLQLIRDEKIAYYAGSYEMFKTIRERLRHGRDFYSQLQESIVILQSSVSEFKQRRHTSRGPVKKSRDPIAVQSKKEAPVTGAPQRPSAPKPAYNRSSSLNNDANAINRSRSHADDQRIPFVPMVTGQHVNVPGQMQPGMNMHPSGVTMMNQFHRPSLDPAAMARFSSPPVSQMSGPHGMRPQRPLQPMQDSSPRLPTGSFITPSRPRSAMQNIPAQAQMIPNTIPQNHNRPNQPMVSQYGPNHQIMYRPSGPPINNMQDASRHQGVTPIRHEMMNPNQNVRLPNQPANRYVTPNTVAGMNIVNGPHGQHVLSDPIQPDKMQSIPQQPYSHSQGLPMGAMQHQGMRQPTMQPRIPHQQWQQQQQFQPQSQQSFIGQNNVPHSRPSMAYQQPMRMQSPMMSQSLPTMLQQPLVPQQSSRHQQRMPIPIQAIQPNQSQQPANNILNRPINQVAPQNMNRVIDDPFSVIPHQNQPPAQFQPASNQAFLPPPLLPEPSKPRAMGNTQNCISTLPQSPQLANAPRMPVPYSQHIASSQSNIRQSNPNHFTVNSLPNNIPGYGGMSRKDDVPQQDVSSIGIPYTMQGVPANAPMLQASQEPITSFPSHQVPQSLMGGATDMGLNRISSSSSVNIDPTVNTTIAPTTAGGAVMTGGRPLMSPMAMGHSPLAGNTVVPVDNAASNTKSANDALALQQFQMQQFMFQQQQQMMSLMQAQRHNEDALHIEQLQRQLQQQQLLIEKISRDQERISANKTDELMLNAKLLDELMHQKQIHTTTPIQTATEASQVSMTETAPPQMSVADIVRGSPTVISNASIVSRGTVADRTVITADTTSANHSLIPASPVASPSSSVPQSPISGSTLPVIAPDIPSQQIPTDYPITSTTQSVAESTSAENTTSSPSPSVGDTPPIIPISREVGTAPFYEPMLDKLTHSDNQRPDHDNEHMLRPSGMSIDSNDGTSEEQPLNSSGVYQSLTTTKPDSPPRIDSPVEQPAEPNPMNTPSIDPLPSTYDGTPNEAEAKDESSTRSRSSVASLSSDSSPMPTTAADITQKQVEKADVSSEDEHVYSAETARRSRSEQVTGERPIRKPSSPDYNRALPDLPSGSVPVVAVTNPSQGDSDEETDRPALRRQFGHFSERRSTVHDEKLAWKLYIDELDSSATAMHQQCMTLCRTNPRTKIDGFTQIWNDLGQIERLDATNFSAHAGKLNVSKNRYRDILPWDHSRVILKTAEQDYINGNSIENLTVLSPDYIATQGPIPQCFADFWCMVWERDITVVVMLTNEVEGTKLKCHPYWPRRIDQPMAYGSIIVNLKDEEVQPDWKDRTMLVTNIKTNESRIIKHLQFTSWPDYGTPDSPFDILAFMEEVYRFHSQQPEPPLLLHCSAGVGRTGTFACIYSAIREVNGGNGLIKVPGTVRKLRQCRAHMVQRKEQLIFCYQAILCHAQQFVAAEQEKFSNEAMTPGQIDEVFDEVLSESDEESLENKETIDRQLPNLQRDAPETNDEDTEQDLIDSSTDKITSAADNQCDDSNISPQGESIQSKETNINVDSDENNTTENNELRKENEVAENSNLDSDHCGTSVECDIDSSRNLSTPPADQDLCDTEVKTEDVVQIIEDDRTLECQSNEEISQIDTKTFDNINENNIEDVSKPSCTEKIDIDSVINIETNNQISSDQDSTADGNEISIEKAEHSNDQNDSDTTSKSENIDSKETIISGVKETIQTKEDVLKDTKVSSLKETTSNQDITTDTLLLDI